MTIEGNFTRLFNSVAEYNEARINNYNEPWVSYTIENSGVSFNKIGYEKFLGTPVTFKIISGGTINWTASKSALTKTIEYKLNDGEWTSITSNTGSSAPSISVSNGDVVQFRGDNATYSTGFSYFNLFSGSTAGFEVEGNIMSLIDSVGFVTATTLTSAYTFNSLFSYCTGLTSAKNIVLPAATLTNNCYARMFEGCTSLTTAPELPATTLTDTCYQGMFYGCINLTTTPELPATTLANNCYSYMFSNCTSLTTAPELPVTTLAADCYDGMFNGCTSLTTAPELPATTLVNSCYREMFYNCTSLTTAPELPVTTLANYCYFDMFNGCTSLTTAPELPATTMTQSCYYGMFRGCTSLTAAPELPATTLADSCYYGMFRGCTSLTAAPELTATTLAERCYYQMFNGCTSLTTAPELPATTLANYCYNSMFSGCTSLNYIKCLATDISATNCTTNWVSGVSQTGTFVKDESMTGWTTGADGIPIGWTVKKTNPVSFTADDIKVGEKLNAIVTCPDGYEGDCHLTINNVKYTVSVAGGKARFVISDIPAGAYTAYVELPETNIYEAGSATNTFNVSKIEPGIEILTDEQVAYEPFVIVVKPPVDYEGVCHLTVNNIEYVKPNEGGTVSFVIPGLPVGIYTVYAELPETAKYESASATRTFEVIPA